MNKRSRRGGFLRRFMDGKVGLSTPNLPRLDVIYSFAAKEGGAVKLVCFVHKDRGSSVTQELNRLTMRFSLCALAAYVPR